MKRELISIVTAISAIVGSGYLGYSIGRERPRVFWATNAVSETGFGWDKGNKCVATWTRTTNFFQWTRLK